MQDTSSLGTTRISQRERCRKGNQEREGRIHIFPFINVSNSSSRPKLCAPFQQPFPTPDNALLATFPKQLIPHARKMHITHSKHDGPHNLTPHTPLPAQTPNQSPPCAVNMLSGAKLTLPTSYSQRQLELGPLLGMSPALAPLPLMLGRIAWFSELMRSQVMTRESSPPEASRPRLCGDHSMLLRLPW